MSSHRDQDDSWNKYWEHGFLTSCRNAFAGNYEGTIKTSWVSFFGALGAGSRVLDICTGNGAIAMIANEVSREKDLGLEIHGIDTAAIRPQDTVTRGRDLLDGISFHGGTPAESTGFGPAHFQAVSGQYALEYTDLESCAAEMARISAPAAKLQFIIHHHESIVMETSREEIRNAALLFADTRFFDRAAAIINKVGAAAGPEARRALASDPDAERAREALNRAAETVSRAAESSPHPQLLQMALQNVAEAYRRGVSGGLEPALALLEESRQRISANVERLKDLMGAGRNEAEMMEIRAIFADHGFQVDLPNLIHHERGPLMGWVLTAQRI
jgi:ubiquinone/menaquinone biosynthesis C-methylase UbiE